MSSPELIDERFEEIARELRALPAAPDRLRDYVRSVAANEPAPRAARVRLPRLTFWNTTLVLAGAAASLFAVSVVYGLVSSGGPGRTAAAPSLKTAKPDLVPATRSRPSAKGVPPRPAVLPGPRPAATTVLVDGGPVHAPSANPRTTTTSAAASAAPPTKLAIGGDGAATGPAVLPPARGRLQKYTASMRLRVDSVDDLSSATARAMRIARSLGGYVVAVNYGTPETEYGTASLKLRVPASNVQRAIVRLSALGTILSQQISITDLQDKINRDSTEIARLERTIARLQAALKRPISAEERIKLETQLDGARATLRALAEGRKNTVRQGRLATISMALTTKKAAEAKPKATHPGRIERAARNAGGFLTAVGAGAVYTLIVLSPVILLGAAALAGSRVRRRRFHQRLLEQA